MSRFWTRQFPVVLSTATLLFFHPLISNAEGTEKEEPEISVQPISEVISAPLFTDVDRDHNAYHAITFLAERGLIDADRNRFYPNQLITRAQAAKMIVEELNLSAPDGYILKATDVNQSHWAYPYFAALEAKGIFTGSNGEMKPIQPLTRAQMATILTRAFSYAEPASFQQFDDVQRNFWAYDAINQLKSNGVTSVTTFRPNEVTTRGQFALFLARTIDDRFKDYQFEREEKEVEKEEEPEEAVKEETGK